jgi:hypothetical protein
VLADSMHSLVMSMHMLEAQVDVSYARQKIVFLSIINYGWSKTLTYQCKFLENSTVYLPLLMDL